MRFFKKNTENKATSKLPMTGKVKKGYRAYCVAVLAMTVVLGTGVTAFAANDPITVVNNLSDFIFGLIHISLKQIKLSHQPNLYQPISDYRFPIFYPAFSADCIAAVIYNQLG